MPPTRDWPGALAGSALALALSGNGLRIALVEARPLSQQPLPEQMISADPEGFWKLKCYNQARGGTPFSSSALAEYLAAFNRPDAIHSSCEDYRAAASIDIEHDNEDQGKKLEMPILALWAKLGVIETCFDAMALWQQRASQVEGEALQATHYMAEEIPDQIAAHMFAFFARHPIYTEAAGLFRS